MVPLHAHPQLDHSALKDIFNLRTFTQGMYFQSSKAIMLEVAAEVKLLVIHRLKSLQNKVILTSIQC